MKTQTLTLISITLSIALSLLITLATYNVTTSSGPHVLDAGWINRGWPLCWMIESWSFWSPPPYLHYFTFQPANFLIDFTLFTIIFQVPMQTYMYLKENRKSRARSNVNVHKPNRATPRSCATDLLRSTTTSAFLRHNIHLMMTL